jgi:uncharacterized phage-associated protein
MALAQDVAAYIIGSLGPITPRELQNLLFYCQAWHLVCRDTPLFDEQILAWEHGPVVREVWKERAGTSERLIDRPAGDSSRLAAEEKAVVQAVLEQYRVLTGRQLSDLVYNEAPWHDTRNNNEDKDEVIDLDKMRSFYTTQLEDTIDLYRSTQVGQQGCNAIPVEDLATELGW